MVKNKTIREGFFDDMIYMVLYSERGVKADRWIDMISRIGAKKTLRYMLIHEKLDGREVIERKPYGMFDDTYQLGDYVLWWDESKRFVKLIEMADKDNPYRNF